MDSLNFDINNIQGAIFDMDGTLVDSLGFWDVLWGLIGDKYLGGKPFVPTVADEKAVRTMTLKGAMELIHDNYGVAESGEALLSFADDSIKEFYMNSVKPKGGVIEFLEALKSNGVKMVVASATAPHLVKISMQKCGLEQYFSEIVSCATLGVGKDRPDVFLLALQRLGTEKGKTWVFEDSAVALATAQSVGFATVGIFDKYTDGQDKVQAASTVYINDGESLLKLIK
ncbi:MAG: HAD family phosphatase [Clostridia bacterium]|nr:HAD family phosphatase [Clostridia bacterium]